MRSLPAQYRPVPYDRDAFLYVHLFSAGLMTAASALVIVAHPVGATGGLLFFGLSFALAEGRRRGRLDAKALARVTPFLYRLRRHNIEGYSWLMRVLAHMDGRTPRARRRSRVALDALSGNDRLMDGLFVHCRRHEVSVAVFADRLGRPGASVLVPALASLHPDGRVREAAVTAMGRRLRPSHLPLLVERAVDWVPDVRRAGHEALRAHLRRHPELSPRARSAYARVAGRRHAPALARLIDEF